VGFKENIVGCPDFTERSANYKQGDVYLPLGNREKRLINERKEISENTNHKIALNEVDSKV